MARLSFLMVNFSPKYQAQITTLQVLHIAVKQDAGKFSAYTVQRKAGIFAKGLTHTRWQGERDSYTAIACDDRKQIIDFFGFGWLAKDLYSEAGINAAVHID